LTNGYTRWILPEGKEVYHADGQNRDLAPGTPFPAG
jgi:hypothetical protein